jgi:hypothetical protein
MSDKEQLKAEKAEEKEQKHFEKEARKAEKAEAKEQKHLGKQTQEGKEGVQSNEWEENEWEAVEE